MPVAGSAATCSGLCPRSHGKTFKLSNDKRFEEKLTDVVGLYLNPPDKAVVLCMDEKSRSRPWTAPSRPCR